MPTFAAEMLDMFIRLHREGIALLIGLGLSLLLLNVLVRALAATYFWPVLVLSVLLYGFVMQFFRNPPRPIPRTDPRIVYAPADGRICAVEEVVETEYFGDKRLQISIFMSPLNVHVNRNPVGGHVRYFRYHPGKYLVAWHPKSSMENEHTSIVYDTGEHHILMRQIAGALARRIKWYIAEGQAVAQGEEMGFITFGSRVDLFLPTDAVLNVRVDQSVRGNRHIIAYLPEK